MVAKELLVDGLVHGMYNHPHAVLTEVDRRMRALGRNPDAMGWMGRTSPPNFLKHRSNVAVGLLSLLDTPEETTQFYLDWIAETFTLDFPGDLRLKDKNLYFSKDPNSERWQPFAKRWVRIDLDAHTGESPQRCATDERIAGLGILAVLAQHPLALKRHDGTDRPGLNITPMMYREGAKDEPHGVFHISYLNGKVTFALDEHPEFESPNWSCPIHV